MRGAVPRRIGLRRFNHLLTSNPKTDHRKEKGRDGPVLAASKVRVRPAAVFGDVAAVVAGGAGAVANDRRVALVPSSHTFLHQLSTR